MMDLIFLQTRVPGREKETSEEIQAEGNRGVKPSRTTTKKAVASSGQGVIESETQGLGTWIQHRKDNSAAKPLLVLCNKPATCEAECLYETLQRSTARPHFSNMLDCGMLLSGSALSPFKSTKILSGSPFVLLLSPHKCLSQILSSFYPFFSGKIRRSVHKLVSWKQKPTFLFSCTKHIFPLCLGTSRQALVIQVQNIPRCT